MKQVYLNFKDVVLGYLTQDGNAYVWVPNAEGIRLFNEKYAVAKSLLFLSSTAPRAYSTIPAHFEEFVYSSSRPDLSKKAKIEPSDTDFERLCKMATLSYFNQDFFISI